jgi:hypothetical protein
LFFQWFFNDQPLSEASSSSLILTNATSGTHLLMTNTLGTSSLILLEVKPEDEGVYRVTLTNSLGSVSSDDALLDVLGFGIGF